MKKKITLILIGIMTMVVIAGCSSGDDTATQQTTGAETTAAAEQTTAAQDQAVIDEAKAKEIALKKVSGAKESDITKIKLEKDDGRQEYEGEIVYNGKEYDFEIDAVSGEVLSWEEDSVNE